MQLFICKINVENEVLVGETYENGQFYPEYDTELVEETRLVPSDKMDEVDVVEIIKEVPDIFMALKDTLETDTAKEYFDKILLRVPPYFFSVPASSSGKYHPDYALGDEGLVRHVVAATRILNYKLGLEYYKNEYSAHFRDMMRLAIVFHDAMKSGTQSVYEHKPNTKFKHPLYAASMVERTLNCNYDSKLIASLISCHMGEWNTSKYESGELPKPQTHMQMMVAEADYLASRKDIEFKF